MKSLCRLLRGSEQCLNHGFDLSAKYVHFAVQTALLVNLSDGHLRRWDELLFAGRSRSINKGLKADYTFRFSSVQEFRSRNFPNQGSGP